LLSLREFFVLVDAGRRRRKKRFGAATVGMSCNLYAKGGFTKNEGTFGQCVINSPGLPCRLIVLIKLEDEK